MDEVKRLNEVVSDFRELIATDDGVTFALADIAALARVRAELAIAVEAWAAHGLGDLGRVEHTLTVVG